MPDCTISPTRFALLVKPVSELVAKAAKEHNVQSQCRKFSAKTHLLLTIFAHLQQVTSSRALVEELNDLTLPLRQAVDFDQPDYFGQPLTLNQSSYSRATAQRSWRLWRYLAYKVLNMVRPKLTTEQLAGLNALPINELLVVDGSLFDCLSNMKWATYRRQTNKVKVHFFYGLDGTPVRLVVSTGKASERAVLAENLRSGFTYLVDRGYNDYSLYGEIMATGSHFVTRLLKNARYQPLAELPLDPASRQVGILADQTVNLALSLSRVSATEPLTLRLIRARDLAGNEYEYLTSRFDLPAQTIVQLYLYRWEVETFIGWFKRHLVFEHWYSHTENGVLIQIWAGLLTFLLLKYYLLVSQQAEFSALRLTNLRWLRRHLLEKAEAVEVGRYTLFSLNPATAPPVKL